MSYGKSIFIILSISGITFAAYNYFSKKKKQKRREFHEVIMFVYGAEQLKKSKYSRCMITKSMDRVLYYLNQPRHSIDICMYVITNMDLTNALMKLIYRGIKIRIIVDADMAFASGSTIRKLEKQGAAVRWRKSTNLMHHKFCLVDTSVEDVCVTPFVMLGSLNWTNQALCGNWEDVAVTSQKELVEQYKVAFEKLWIDFKPIVPVL